MINIAKWTIAFLENLAQAVVDYTTIYLTEDGNMYTAESAARGRSNDKRRQTPSIEIRYVKVHRGNFPKTVEALEEMFDTQQIERRKQEQVAFKAEQAAKGAPSHFKIDAKKAFAELTSTDAPTEETIDLTEQKAKPGRKPKVVTEQE